LSTFSRPAIHSDVLFKKINSYFGPSTLVTAAFIGPGTVTVCTLAGVNSGFTLLWALLFSVVATIILQEMTARLGLITQQGLGEAIRKELKIPALRIAGIFLIVSAIVIGNGAYEAGNISGAVLGVEEVFKLNIQLFGFSLNLIPLMIGAIAFWLLFSGNFKKIEQFLVALVILMSLVFVTTAVIVRPNLLSILEGLLIPSASPAELLTVVALIGTTVVPYNLFLHASSVKEKWKSPGNLAELRKENAVAIILGGIISICIVITSGAAFSGTGVEITNAAEMAAQLEPLLGAWAKYILALGLFSAGITSAITAPLAAAYASQGIFGWSGGMTSKKFRSIWIVILLAGTVFSSVGYRPVEIIQFAQVANGILLPVIAIALLYIMNKSGLLGEFVNSRLQNMLGIVIVFITLLIGFRSLNSVFQFFG